MTRHRAALFLTAAGLLSSAVAAQEALRPEHPVAFVGGMLLDGYEAEPIHHSVVVIDDGRIIAEGTLDDTNVPENAIIEHGRIVAFGRRTAHDAGLDAGGDDVVDREHEPGFVCGTLGIIDAHVHVDLIGHGDYDRYYKFLRGMERLHEVMPIAAKQMLRAGVTSAIDLGTPFQILTLRERIRSGEIPGPRLT
ncbi:MAG: amidohydrolase family protein, partial [Woeseiaceae bacterium]